MEKIFRIELTQPDVANIVVALKRFPMDQVETLVNSITSQYLAQVQEPTPTIIDVPVEHVTTPETTVSEQSA